MENQPKQIACSNEKCGKRFADLLGDGTIEIFRRGHQVLMTGQSYSVIGTCFACREKTALAVKDGKLVEDGVKFREVKAAEDDTPEGEKPPAETPPAPEEPPAPPEPEVPTPAPAPEDPKLVKVK